MGFLRKLFFQITYLQRPPWDTGISPPELIAFIQTHPAGRAVDLGCGTGTNAITLAKHGWEVVGVDYIRRAIRTARQNARQARVDIKFLLEDVTHLEELDGNFDLVLDIGCFHNLPQDGKTRYMKQLQRLLAPSGAYLVYGFIQQTGKNTGVSEADILQMSRIRKLHWRQDGFDQGERPSAWFLFND